MKVLKKFFSLFLSLSFLYIVYRGFIFIITFCLDNGFLSVAGITDKKLWLVLLLASYFSFEDGRK